MAEKTKIPGIDIAGAGTKSSGKSLFFQPKLSINQPNDAYEQEADAVADKVMRMKDSASEKKFFSPPVVQKKSADREEEERKLQRLPVDNKIVIQRQESADNEQTTTREPPALLPPLRLTPPYDAVDFLGLQQTFFNRGVLFPGSYMGAAQQEWGRQYRFYSMLGLGNALGRSFMGDTLNFFGVTPPGGDWNAWLANTTTPLAVDSALSRDFPTFNESEARRGGLPAPTIINAPALHFKKEKGHEHETNEIKQSVDNSTTQIQQKCAHCEEDKKQVQRKESNSRHAETTGEQVNTPVVHIQQKCAACEEEEKKKLQRKETENGTAKIDQTENYLKTLSGGSPLEANNKDFFGSRMGYDFSNVRIHSDSTANESAKNVNALAYTHGNNIVFGSGQYQPGTDEGKKLLAHELTHVVQQNSNTISAKPMVQRFVPEKTPDLIIENAGSTIDENIFYLDSATTSLITRFAVMYAGRLEVYEPKAPDASGKQQHKLLETFTIKKNVNPPPLLYVLQNSGFYVYAYNYNLEKHVFAGKKTSGISDEAKAMFAKWDAVMTINNWFEKQEDCDKFVNNHITSHFLGLWVTDAASSTTEKTDDKEEIPPRPEWMAAWEKAMIKLISDTRKADPDSTDIPEVFKFYYSKTKLRWRALANMTLEKKKFEVYLDINEKDDKAQKLALIRDKLKIKQLSPDEPKERSADVKDLEEELTWAYRVKLELDKKIAEERALYPTSADLPDKTAIVSVEDQPGKPFLKLSVYVVENLPENTAITSAKAKSVLKTGTLPQPLTIDVSIDQLFDVVKKATLAIRGQFSKSVISNPEKAEKVLEPFPSSISVIAGRDDFKTVTGAALDVHMNLNMSSVEGNNLLHQTGIAYRGIYYTWDIYRIGDILSDAEKKTLNSDWKKRREQLAAMLKDSTRMKGVNPVINQAKLAEWNRLLKQYNIPEIDATQPLNPETLNQLRREDYTYGSATRLTPDTTLTFPPDEDEYVVYCRAVAEPDGKVFRLPSEAFYPIKVLNGYTLAEENRDLNLEEINDLNKQLAEVDLTELPQAEKDKKKKELQDKIAEIKTREKQSLGVRTASDLSDVVKTKQMAAMLEDLYKRNQYKRINIPQEILKANLSVSETNDLLQLYFTIETTNQGGGTQLEKLAKMITQLESQIKGLKTLQNSIGAFAEDMDGYKAATYTPVTALVSNVTGEVYSLITMMGVRTNDAGGTEVILVDVTTYQTQKKYFGSSSQGGNEGLKEAIQNAYNSFGEECKYGEGAIAYRIPGANIYGRAKSKPGFKQKVLEILGYVAMAAGIAALVLGTIATGGALGVAAFALGIGAGVIGAGLAIHNIYDRSVNHRIEADVELAMDVLNIIGPFLQGLSALSKVAKLGQAAKLGQMIKAGVAVEESAETIAAVAKLHRLVQIQKAFAILQKGEAITNLTLLGYKTFKDLAAISEAYKDDPKKRAAMEWEVLKNAALAGTLALVALRNEFKPTSAHMNDMEGLVNAGYKEKNYLEMMKRSGLFDAEGKWNDPVVKAADESVTTKEKAAAEAEAKEAAKSGDTEAKTTGTETKTTEDATKPQEGEARPQEPETKPQQTETKPVADTPAAGDVNAAKPETPSGETTPTETPSGKTPKPKKPRQPKEKLPVLVIDKPVTMSDGSVATLRADGSIEIRSRIGKGTGRKGYEKRMLSGIKVGLKGWHRAHSQGQGTGSESPYGIFYAPPEVNLAYQNSGIEARIREIFRISPPDAELSLTTITKPHPNADGKPSRRLASIEYRIEVSEPGKPRKYLVLEAGIKVQDAVNKPKVEVSAESFLANALWSIHFGDGTMLGMSADKFNALKKNVSELEKQLTELIERLTIKLKTSFGKQKALDQFHLERFKEWLDTIYRNPDPDLVPHIKAEMEEAAMLYPKQPLISADAQSYLNTWRGKINQGSRQHIARLLELSGSWKDLITKLQADPKANKTTLKILETFRNNLIKRLKKSYNADTLPDASTKPESDVDLNLKGTEAGANLIKAEAEMQAEFGENWSKLLRLNFYTEGDRLLRYQTAKLSPEAVQAFEKQLAKKTMHYSLAKMLQHAKQTPEGTERVTKLISVLAPQDAAAIKSMADVDPGTMLQKRNQLHAEVDTLQKELSQLSPGDAAYAEKSMQVSLKQIEINFYSAEAYIGPGALMKAGAVQGSPALKMQKVMSNLEMMEHILHQTNSNIVRAMKEYEMYKYMFRISDGINAAQMDLFFDYLTKQISQVNRQGAQGMTPVQLNSLYNDFMNMVNQYLATEIKNL